MSGFVNGDEVIEFFRKSGDDFLVFKRVANKASNRPDLNAFILLDKLVPGDMDIIAGSDHDVIYLEVSPDELAKVATEEDILTLVRCGVRWSSEYDCLTMYT